MSTLREQIALDMLMVTQGDVDRDHAWSVQYPEVQDELLDQADAAIARLAAQEAADALVEMSEWFDAGNAHRDPEAVTWGRLAKLTEESGEVIEAFIGATGQNPRKGITHSMDDVAAELLDVAITALGAYEHIKGHEGTALRDLGTKIQAVNARAAAYKDDR